MAEPNVLALESAWTESGASVPSQTNRRLSRAAIVLLGRRGLASNAPAAEFTVNDGIPKPLRESGTYTRGVSRSGRSPVSCPGEGDQRGRG